MRGTRTQEFTELLRAWSSGDEKALERLMPLIYEELRRLARRYLRGERSGHTLQTTALVHEAYLRLVDRRRLSIEDRDQFLALSAQTMRRVLVDHARHHRASKRQPPDPDSLGDATQMACQRPVDLLDLDDALTELSRLDDRPSRVVELRFFGGLTVDETARALGIAPSTVKRDWRLARAWLYQRIADGSGSRGPRGTAS